jgi:hypothetical protein
MNHCPAPIEWALLVGGVDVSCLTGVDFTVTAGRDGDDGQPDPGSGRFTLHAVGSDRLEWLSAMTVVELHATIAGQGQVVWTGRLNEWRRKFQLGHDLRGRTTVSIIATGPMERLSRDRVGATSRPWGETDGARILAWVQESRWTHAESVHEDIIHNDADGSAWSPPSPHTYTGTVDLARAATPAEAVPAAAVAIIVEVDIDLEYPGRATATLSLPGAFGWSITDPAREVAASSSTTRLQWVVMRGAAAAATAIIAPIVRLDSFASDVDVAWDLAPTGPWTTWVPATVTWRGQPLTVTATVESARWSWVSSWDMGTVRLTARPEDLGDARSLIAGAADAAFGVLWESRGGGVTYDSLNARRGTTEVWGAVDAAHLLAESETVTGVAQVVNDITVSYGDPPLDPDTLDPTGDRPSVTRTNLTSIDAFGWCARDVDGPIADEATAALVADHVISTSATPREELSELVTRPLEDLPTTAQRDFLAVPLGALIEVVGAHPGWLATSWRGFIEGWELSGGTGRETALTLNVSPQSSALLPKTVLQELK